MVAGLGILKSLFICGILQALSNLVFVYQALAGHDLTALTITVAVENIATGMGSTAFVAYLSSLCNQAYTATQYALLTSVMGGARTFLSASAGWFADQMDWVSFFVLTTVSALPGFVAHMSIDAALSGTRAETAGDRTCTECGSLKKTSRRCRSMQL